MSATDNLLKKIQRKVLARGNLEDQNVQEKELFSKKTESSDLKHTQDQEHSRKTYTMNSSSIVESSPKSLTSQLENLLAKVNVTNGTDSVNITLDESQVNFPINSIDQPIENIFRNLARYYLQAGTHSSKLIPLEQIGEGAYGKVVRVFDSYEREFYAKKSNKTR